MRCFDDATGPIVFKTAEAALYTLWTNLWAYADVIIPCASRCLPAVSGCWPALSTLLLVQLMQHACPPCCMVACLTGSIPCLLPLAASV